MPGAHVVLNPGFPVMRQNLLDEVVLVLVLVQLLQDLFDVSLGIQIIRLGRLWFHFKKNLVPTHHLNIGQLLWNTTIHFIAVTCWVPA
jgi:hypothetical protein